MSWIAILLASLGAGIVVLLLLVWSIAQESARAARSRQERDQLLEVAELQKRAANAAEEERKRLEDV